MGNAGILKPAVAMLISHIHRFIYTKTVKTGGTSVEVYFEPYCVDPARSLAQTDERQHEESAWGVVGSRGALSKWYNHMPAGEIRALLGEEVWQRYFKFCVVRNPFDKVVSQFWFRISDKERQRLKSADFSVVRKAFSQWCRLSQFPLDRQVYTIDEVPAMDCFVRYERLHEGLEQVCGRLKIPWQPERVGTFKSGYRGHSEHFTEYYTQRTAALVRASFAWELEYFQYTENS